MVISRANMMKELVPGLHKLFGNEYKRYPEMHKAIYEVLSSDRSFEEETKLTGFDVAPVKAEGAPVQYDNFQEVWTARYNHETIALAFSFTEEAMEDNLYLSLGARGAKALARAFAETKQVKAHDLLNRGFATLTGGDGVFYFSTAHPLASGGTNANRPTTGTDLNETSLEAAIIQMADWTDERGLLINARPQKMIVPPDLEFTAQRILMSTGRPDTANNDINAVNSLSSVPQGFAVSYYLTDANAWFLKTDVNDGYKHFVRVKMKTSTDGDFESGNFKYKGRERYSFGVSDPLGMWGNPGST